MTYLQTALLATAATFVMATPSFAGDQGDYNKMDKETVHSEMNMKATQKMEARATVMNAAEEEDFVGEILQSNETNVRRAEGDDKLLLADGEVVREGVIESEERDMTARNNAIVVPTTDGEFATTVACPVGTTAQPNMTCLVTGNYNSDI